MKFLSALLLIMVAVSCKKNPYPENGVILSDEPTVPVTVDNVISADLPANVEFVEGEETSIKLRVVVPNPGDPLVKIKNLPDGASFDEETFTLKWVPDYQAANEISDPSVKSRIYQVFVEVRSTESEIKAISRSMNLVVKDSARPIVIKPNFNATNVFSIEEGKSAAMTFSVNNLDFSQGPFEIALADFPSNVLWKKIDENNFKIEFKPDHQHVLLNNSSAAYCNGSWSSGNACYKYKSRIIVTNPAGTREEVSIPLEVKDVRLDPKVQGADKLDQGLDVSFQVSAFDLNYEVVPKISLLTAAPNFGNFKQMDTEDAASFSNVRTIQWSDIPPKYNGQSFAFNFRICTLSTRNNNWDRCVEKTVNVKVQVKDHLPATIDRAQWSVSETKFLNLNDSLQVRLPVRDQEESTFLPEVKIIPDSMSKYVQWNNDVLTLKFDSDGQKNFQIHAVSKYGIKTIEAFSVEVFPAIRGKILFLADASSKDKELLFFKKYAPNLGVFNPLMEKLDHRMVAGRDLLIIGTSVLIDPVSQVIVQSLIDKVKNVMIATPLFHLLPAGIYQQITSDFKVSVVGRFSALSSPVKLSNLEFVTRSDFDVPKNPLKLAGQATADSANPTIFSTGVDTKNCDDVLEVSDKQRLHRYKIGIICDRPNKAGRIAILGTEWADLGLVSAEQEIIALKWFQTMLNAGLNDGSEVTP